VGLLIKDSIGPGNCVADAWSCAGVHYFAIKHRWPVLHEKGHIEVKQALLSCQPFIDETSFNAKSTAESIEATYSMYGSVEDLIICFTLDNTNVNPATARLLNVPMVGAYCHWLNLACRLWLQEAFDGALMNDLEAIHAVMLRASTLKGRGALKKHTVYVPEKQNKTRWTGYQDMAIKYTRIHTVLEKTDMFTGLTTDDIEEIEVSGNDKKKKVMPLLLRGTALNRFKEDFVPCMKELKQWFGGIQHDINLLQAQQLFENARKSRHLKDHSTEFEERLLPNHKLVASPYFENGVVKIMSQQTEDMTPEEKEACECLLKRNWPSLYPNHTDHEVDEVANGVVDSPTKFLKTLEGGPLATSHVMNSRYITNCTWISPTTVAIERLFSKCSNVMKCDRRKMHPRIFEAIVFLKENEDWWDLIRVQQMVAKIFDERLNEEYDEDDEEEDDDDTWEF